MSRIITSNDLLSVWHNLPKDATSVWDPITNITYDIFNLHAQCSLYPLMTWSPGLKLLDPKGHVIMAIRDLFDDWVDEEVTMELDLRHLGCKHQPAAAPMQNPQDNLKWWLYCKTCGDWLRAADVPGNGGEK